MNVMDATYLDIRSVHGCVWLVEWKQKTGMAGSSIFDVGRSRTSESEFVHMQILASVKKKHTVMAGRTILSE